MEDNGKQSTTLNRRSVLKSAAAGATASAMVGAASGKSVSYSLSKEEVERVTAEYRDPETVGELFERHSEVLEAAAEAGYLESASSDALDVETDFEAFEASGRDRDMALFNAKKVGNDIVPEIRVVREFDDGSLTLATKPTKNAGYAVFMGDDGMAEELYRRAASKDDVSANACDECAIDSDCASNEECQSVGDSCCCDPSCPNMTCITYKCVCVENCGSW